MAKQIGTTKSFQNLSNAELQLVKKTFLKAIKDIPDKDRQKQEQAFWERISKLSWENQKPFIIKRFSQDIAEFPKISQLAKNLGLYKEEMLEPLEVNFQVAATGRPFKEVAESIKRREEKRLAGKEEQPDLLIPFVSAFQKRK